MARRLAQEAIEKGIIPPLYAGATPERCATDLTLELADRIREGWKNSLKATILTFDVKGAFDLVVPDRLTARLAAQGWPVNWVR